ncbi:MAG: hypothetical protein DRI97_05110 [Bacteroidetes bacterium]|nr:MAG: hypothetical protein DRQ40_00770 [Gammaproteobacteria bacterium]RLD57543.1 MAG: hypothetical protein DRI97_05110 [Bacteroidota bacterium]
MAVPFHEGIRVDDVDISFKDPNIRGATGSIMHAGTEADREDFERWLKEGVPYDDALQNLAKRIARRAQRSLESTQEEM